MINEKIKVFIINNTWHVVRPVVDIDVTDAYYAPQVHPPRRCLCVIKRYHALTTRCTSIIITPVHCFIRSPVFSTWPGMSLPNRLTKRNIFLKYLLRHLHKLHRNYNNTASVFVLYERHFKENLPNPFTESVLNNEYVTITNHILTVRLSYKKVSYLFILSYSNGTKCATCMSICEHYAQRTRGNVS